VRAPVFGAGCMTYCRLYFPHSKEFRRSARSVSFQIKCDMKSFDGHQVNTKCRFNVKLTKSERTGRAENAASAGSNASMNTAPQVEGELKLHEASA